MIENKLSDENKEIINKLQNNASTIMKLYQKLIANEIENNNDKDLVESTIDKLLMVIEQEDLLIEKYVNVKNIEDLLLFMEDELSYFEEDAFSNSTDDLRILIIRRVYHNLIKSNIVLNGMKYEIKHKMINDLGVLYFIKIIEDESKINQNYRKELIRKKYYAIYTNQDVENLVIANNFVADADYPNFINCIDSNKFTEKSKHKIGKELIECAIGDIEELDDAFGLEAIYSGLYLRSCFLLVNEFVANEVITNYIHSIDETEYSENEKIVADAYHESKADRHKYIQKYILGDDDIIKDENEVKNTLKLLVEKAENILKLYKKIIESKRSQNIDQEEIENYRDYIQVLIENEFKFYKDILLKKEDSIKLEIYCVLYDKLFSNSKKHDINRFNGLLMKEEFYPEIRVLSLLKIFLINNGKNSVKERFEECERIISLTYLMRLLEADNPYTTSNKLKAQEKSHMISYLNPEIENLTLCNLFYGINNYPDQILEKQSDDQKFKNEIAQNIIAEVINQLLAHDNIDNETLGIQCLYIQSTLMLTDDYIVAQLKRNITSLLISNAQEITELSKINDSIEITNKIKTLKNKRNIIKNILVAISESRNEKEHLKLIKTYEKELNR